jgi:NAD(P)H dehydrogenase (quinone)
MLVVTGSTGHVGRLVAEELAARGHDQRLLVRDPSRAPALNEGDRVFMVSLHEGPERRVPLHRSFVSAAEAAGVAHVVYLSFVAAGPDAVFLHARSHGVTEELLAQSGMSFTSIRNCVYADDIPGWFDAEGIDRVPGGDGRMCFSYRPELARAIAVTLTEPRHESRAYDIVTPDAVSLAELAEVASEVTGDPYRYEPSDDAAWDARWRGRGKEEWAIEAGLSSYAALRQGEFDVRSDDYRTLTGEDPLTVAGVIARLSDRMPLHRE